MHWFDSSSARKNIIFFVVVFLILITDQFSKLWITAHLSLGQSLPETGFFRFEYAQNTGVAFGLFYGNNAILTILVVIEAIVILFYFFVVRHRYPFLNTSLNTISAALIFGGLSGNLVDRVRIGHVTDFIRIGPWPNFNLADSSGVIGVLLFALSILLLSQHTSVKPNS
jgi:signal peptidase II